ncbi:tryptophan 2,3-dioxygenase-like [Haliotis rubra]|uniref:tryptophan 2,3-dioxygenase-like n=1 Tax=Haliotis rubra TaxID=36100 RepID=UPI001EE5E212|nr:tryptophan 2,3-dioxygenase-like [Haliotis rubra]
MAKLRLYIDMLLAVFVTTTALSGSAHCSCIERGMAEGGSKPTYGSYLKLPELLACQAPITDVHDEQLFIIVHQAFELWFKLIIHDITSVRNIFHGKGWKHVVLHTAINRLQRAAMVLRLAVEQFHILETMPPLNFMDFRHVLAGMSGCQSLQFRMMEKLFGINHRHEYKGQSYMDKMNTEDKEVLQKYPDQDDGGTLLDVVQAWLESTPGIDDRQFWDKYRQNENVDLSSLLDQSAYKKGSWQMSQRSLQGALLIMLHQDKPEFQLPYQLLTLLMDIDVALMKWRSTHIQMVHRMIGQKQGTGGTGGTSGYEYLRATYSDDYKAFGDLFKITTYLRPRAEIPELATQHG